MPRNTRQWAQRKLDEANNTLDWTATHLKAVYDVYNKPHPEIGEIAEHILNVLALISQEITNLKGSF